MSLLLRVVYTPTYPEEAPELSFSPVKGLTDEQVDECAAEVRGAVEENLGTAMVYALIEKAQEWLVERNKPELDMHAEMMARLAVQGGGDADGGDGGDGDGDGGGAGGGGGGAGFRDRRKKKLADGEGTWRANAEGGDAQTGEYTPVTMETFLVSRGLMGWDGMAWDGTGRDGMGRGGMGWNGELIG